MMHMRGEVRRGDEVEDLVIIFQACDVILVFIKVYSHSYT